MKTVSAWLIAILLSILPISSSFCSELDEPLQILQPLLGQAWVGGFVGEDVPDLEISLAFEIILDGKAVLYTRKAPGADFEAVMHFFWDPNPGEVRFISLNNRGLVGQGKVTAEEGKLVLQGKSSRPDTTIEFKTTLTVDSAGTLTDRFMRKENGKWVQGHLQKFAAAKGP